MASSRRVHNKLGMSWKPGNGRKRWISDRYESHGEGGVWEGRWKEKGLLSWHCPCCQFSNCVMQFWHAKMPVPHHETPTWCTQRVSGGEKAVENANCEHVNRWKQVQEASGKRQHPAVQQWGKAPLMPRWCGRHEMVEKWFELRYPLYRYSSMIDILSK